MTDTAFKRIHDRFEKLSSSRGVWDDHWQRLGELMLPKRADFTVREAKGSRRQGGIVRYDGTPILAARNLASAIDGLLKPKTERWFAIKAEDPELNDLDEVKLWLEDAEDRMIAALYNRRARFLQATGEVDLDLVVFGTAVLFTGISHTFDKLLFRSFHLKNTYIQRNNEGDVDAIYIRDMKTARQATQEFGSHVGDLVKEAMEKGKGEDEFEFVWAVAPRSDRDARRIDNRNFAWSSEWIDVKGEKRVSESGFKRFPFQVPTWDNAADEIYGRSPGMVALADSNTVNSQARTILRAGEKVTDPPLLVANDSIMGRVKMFAGGINYFDADAARRLGRIPLEALKTGGQIPIGREMQNDTREQIWQAFFRNILQLPIDRPQMTATEVLERKEEFIRTIGPVFGRLESDYTGAIIDEVFAIMAELKSFREAPDILKGKDVRFEYTSPVQRAREQIQAAAAARSAEVLQPYVLADPTVMDNFDGDQISRDVGVASGMPSKWLVPVDVRDRKRQERNQQIAEQQQKEEALMAVDAGSKVAQSGLIEQISDLGQPTGPPAPGTPEGAATGGL